MIVISNSEELEIGKSYQEPITDIKGEPHNVAFLVVKNATRDEYKEDLKKHGADPMFIDLPPWVITMKYFYWVVMD